MASHLTLEDYFLREYQKGSVARANLVDTDFTELVKKYNNGELTFQEYSNQFYKTALGLIINRVKSYPI